DVLLSLFLFLLSEDPSIDCYRQTNESLLTLEQVFNTGVMVWDFIWLAGIGFAAGVYTVPLYALIQQPTHPDSRSRVIAAKNVLNA
ncbi:MFS transporter, partial [Pseudoalteromonas sp. S3173]